MTIYEFNESIIRSGVGFVEKPDIRAEDFCKSVIIATIATASFLRVRMGKRKSFWLHRRQTKKGQEAMEGIRLSIADK